MGFALVVPWYDLREKAELKSARVDFEDSGGRGELVETNITPINLHEFTSFLGFTTSLGVICMAIPQCPSHGVVSR